MPRASRRKGDAARRHADTVRFVLFEARPAGLEFHQLVRASALSPHQVRSGPAALKDEAASKARRHARDHDRLIQHSETLITWAAITLMTRRLTRGTGSLDRISVTPPRILQNA